MVTQVIHYFTKPIAYKSEKVFDFILENKMNLDGKNIDGNTLELHMAVLNGSEFQAYRLTKLGASVQKVNNLGDTVLHSAVRGGNIKIVASILHFNSSIKVKNNLGETPLQVKLLCHQRKK